MDSKDGCQDGHHYQMKINLLTNRHIILSNNTFSTIFGMENQFVVLFLQFEVNNKVTDDVNVIHYT